MSSIIVIWWDMIFALAFASGILPLLIVGFGFEIVSRIKKRKKPE